MNDGLGTRFKKVVYREYTDDTFRTQKGRTNITEYLGIMGPSMKAAAGDFIQVKRVYMLKKNLQNIIRADPGTHGKGEQSRCAPLLMLIVIMLHNLSLALNVQQCNNKETPGNDSHILSFIISVFISVSLVPVRNILHFLYFIKHLSLLSVFTARP